MKPFDTYEMRANYVPAIITALPAIMLSAFIKQDVWISIFENVNFFIVIENLSISLVVIIFIIHVQRGIAKHLFEALIFKSGKEFPTTRMLLLSDKYLSMALKRKIRRKIETDFDLRLYSEEEEQEEPEAAKKIIRDAVNLLRKKDKRGDKTFQYNIHYGFSRNLIAGSIFAIPISIIDMLLFGKGNIAGFSVSAAMAGLFFFNLIFSKKILLHYANTYSECLLSEYLTITKGVNHG